MNKKRLKGVEEIKVSWGNCVVPCLQTNLAEKELLGKNVLPGCGSGSTDRKGHGFGLTERARLQFNGKGMARFDEKGTAPV
ncbi:uncharacterized protein G2W53_041753 [Senna tora]|uniref:Uncharacterized protein n=1 Tax=Senna tora TaxID=362788 RepID=A0A834VZ11_9FABA|nr:uncharacterized protein G2W53_041753 [Senna tora]